MKAYERFLKYITFDTQSDEESPSCPSTAKQKLLGEALVKELREIGAAGVEMDEFGYVYATVPASKGAEGKPAVAFLSHMDTAGEMPGRDVKARIIEHYDGRDIVLNSELGIVTDVKSFPLLSECIGDDLIVTDGTTLLGSDDKSGIAAIMTAAESWLGDNAAADHDPALFHPEIRIVFTPDEEIGRGTDKIDLKKVNALCGYTVDGTGVDHLQYECFQAAAGVATFKGTAVHPGSSFGIMKNASLLAMEFQSMLPVYETPAATCGRMGFFHITEMTGSVDNAEIHYIIRDHDKAVLEHRKEVFRRTAELMNLKHGEGTVSVRITDSYPNMIEYILPKYPFVLEAAREAIREAGMVPVEDPVRGGTDGAQLSAMGLPCPNLSVGGYYCHGAHEFASVQKMDQIVEVLKGIAKRLG